MISYEKTARAFKSSTIAIAVLNILTFVLGLWGLLGIVSIQQAMKNGTIDKFNLTAKQLAAVKQSITPLSISITILAIIIAATIAVFCFLNLSKLKKQQTISFIPYYLGIGIKTFDIIYSLIFGTFAVFSFIIQIAFIVLYFYTIQKARILAEKEEA
ncbi:hypothetical protein [Streptococcus mutans]|uniref:hypothetical protein n=1 Tax=Streptococcus mutans TaxID=1309 RepID=UPI0002B533FA|nr:hypothetical protein [Streptococcus mutans]EMB74862.1 hypothetical protein SMU40_02840 [Streptococcus mutans 15VF2]NLQ44266.1 hypothetical protein [Streptococcus mutans]NLQ56041.1 hypothetical protein [Streptococcus mutans]